jgi:galactose mutarotase-like enzyme
LALDAHGALHAATAQRAPFGKLPDGTVIEAVTLRNSRGISARILPYGATLLQALWVTDPQGRLADIALGYDDLAGYIEHPNYYGEKFPNAPNVPQFVPARLDPGSTYHHRLILRFSATH